MKKYLSSVVLAVVFALILRSNPAFSGNEGAHGGDPYALEFTTIGASLADQLAQYEKTNGYLFDAWHFTAADFRRAVLGDRTHPLVRVTSDERVYLKNAEVGATNDAKLNLIDLSRSLWREDQLLERVKLVLHEYFGVLGIEQDHYDASIDFADFAVQATRTIQQLSGSEGFMANLFYGYASSYPALDDKSAICDPSAPRIEEAVESATRQAQASCEISHAKCRILNTTYSEVVSMTWLGVKYCEVLVLMK